MGGRRGSTSQRSRSAEALRFTVGVWINALLLTSAVRINALLLTQSPMSGRSAWEARPAGMPCARPTRRRTLAHTGSPASRARGPRSLASSSWRRARPADGHRQGGRRPPLIDKPVPLDPRTPNVQVARHLDGPLTRGATTVLPSRAPPTGRHARPRERHLPWPPPPVRVGAQACIHVPDRTRDDVIARRPVVVPSGSYGNRLVLSARNAEGGPWRHPGGRGATLAAWKRLPVNR